MVQWDDIWSIVLQFVQLSSDMNHNLLILSLCPLESVKNKTGVHILTNFYWKSLTKWKLVPLSYHLHAPRPKWSILFTKFDLDVRLSNQRMIESGVLKSTVKTLIKTYQFHPLIWETFEIIMTHWPSYQFWFQNFSWPITIILGSLALYVL